VNAQELFLDVSSGRFLDGESTIPTNKPTFYSDEQKRVRLSVRKIANNKISLVTPSADARYKFRLGTATAKLADGVDVSVTPPVPFTALAQVVTAGATQATGIALLSNYTAVTAVIRADVSQVTAVTATITIGISASTSFISTTTLAIPVASKSIVASYFGGDFLGAAKYLENPQRYPFGRPLPVVLVMTASLNNPVQAQFSTVFLDGSVATIGTTNRGFGYPDGTFALSFSGGGATAGTVTATATAVASGGIITSVNLTSGGSGYASAPTASLFIPEKQVVALSVTNKIGDVGSNKQRFYWAYATTSVSTPIVAVNFSAPNATTTTALLSAPSAFISSVTENIWELTLVSGGYGYTSTPSVTHDAALVSTSKISTVVTLSNPSNPWAIIADFSGQTYIKNGGCAVRYANWQGNSTRYADPGIASLGGVWKTGGSGARSSVREVLLSRYSKDFNSFIKDVDVSPVPEFYEVEDSYGNKEYITNVKKVDSSGNITYQIPSIFYGGNDGAGGKTWNDGNRLKQVFSGVAYGAVLGTRAIGAVTKPAIIKISTAQENLNYSVVYVTPQTGYVPSADKFEITAVQIGGGMYEPSIEIVDYGENYPNNITLFGYLPFDELRSLEPRVLVETVNPVTAYLLVEPLDTPLSYRATIATRPGRFGTQYEVQNGGFGYVGGALGIISSLPVATGGIVTTARLTNTPQAYDDGEYDCTIQSPSVGTAANIKLIFENGVGRAVIFDGGAGYTSAPIVTAPAPNLRTGIIENAIVTNRPQGYEIGKTYLLETQSSPITGGNCSLSLTNTQNGYVVQIVDGGFGYSSSPIVTAPSPDLPQGVINFIQTTTQGQGYANGTYDCDIQVAPAGGKTLKAVFQKDGTQGAFNVIEQGYGYTTAPIVSVATPIGNLINGITITCGGSFYQNTSIQFKLNDSTGADAILNTPTICGGIVRSILVQNKGYGYSDTPTIVFEAPQLPLPTPLQLSQVEGDLNITTASANVILSTATQRDILLEVFETDGTNEQVVAQATVSLAKRVLE
jgi:hypothetical protein